MSCQFEDRADLADDRGGLERRINHRQLVLPYDVNSALALNPPGTSSSHSEAGITR